MVHIGVGLNVAHNPTPGISPNKELHRIREFYLVAFRSESLTVGYGQQRKANPVFRADFCPTQNIQLHSIVEVNNTKVTTGVLNDGTVSVSDV